MRPKHEGGKRMFSNIGKKIKTVAKVEFYLLTASSIIGGLYVIFNFGSMLGTGTAILLGILIMLVGALLAWVSSFMLYGYGELVDNTTAIRNALSGGAPASPTAPKASPFQGLARAVSSARSQRSSPAQPVQPAQQPQEPRPAYQPPQTVPAQGRPANPYGQSNPYQRAGSYPPAQQQPASLTGKSGWLQVSAQDIQCPSCRAVLPAAQMQRYGCCPQCRMPFNP